MSETEPISTQEQEGEEQKEQFEDLSKFQQEIQRLKEKEAKEGETAHFSGSGTDIAEIHPEHLTEEDMEAYNRFLSADKFDEGEFDYYKTGIKQELRKNPEDSKINSRAAFSYYLGNIYNVRTAKEELRKLKGE